MTDLDGAPVASEAEAHDSARRLATLVNQALAGGGGIAVADRPGPAAPGQPPPRVVVTALGVRNALSAPSTGQGDAPAGDGAVLGVRNALIAPSTGQGDAPTAQGAAPAGDAPVRNGAASAGDGTASTVRGAASAGDGAVPVFLYGQHVVVGPVRRAGSGAGCPRCLARRWQSVRPADLRDAIELGGQTTAVGGSPFLTAFAADAVAATVAWARSPAGAPPAGDPFGVVYHLDLVSMRLRQVPLVPDAECPACGRVRTDSRDAAVVSLAAAPKRTSYAFRGRAIEEYPLRIEAFANPVCGALSAALLDDLTSTSTAAALGAFTLRSGRYLRETLYGGHADSYRHSRMVAVFEGLERAAGLRARGRRAAVRATLRELGAAALDPRDCGLYSAAFYEANPYLSRFDPDQPISWVWGTSLVDDRQVLVPEIFAYYHVPPVEARFVQETSNGCASGGSLAEAVYFGLMEAVERDAFLIAWFGRAALPEIDPTSSTRAGTRQMVDRLAMYGYRARFFDARITFAIPVVTAVAERVDGGAGTLAFGGGASLDPEQALGAALREIATDSVKLPVRTRAGEARLRAMAADFSTVFGLHDHPLLYGIPQMRGYAAFLLDGGAPPGSLAQRFAEARPAPPAADDLVADVQTCVAEVAKAGFDVIVVDQTMPEERDLGLHTVKVMVPGLVPIDFGWLRQRAPLMARVRTALTASGHRERDLTVDELNPAPHPFP